MLKRIGTALGLLALCALSVVRVARPPAARPASAPDTVFSAERAMRHVEEMAQRPHSMGSADHDRVRDYIVTQLTALGLRPQLQQATAIGTRYQEAGRVQNIVAWLPGSDPKGKAVLIMAHYDGVEAGPAAADDAAGSAAILETLRAIKARKQPLAHDVIALFTDGEESGLLGAAAFVREHPWAKDVAIALNFEARGTSGRSLMFETGPGNLDAARVLRTVPGATAGSVFTTVYRLLPNDTDLSELAVLGVPALNFAFAEGVERYHTSHDDVAHLDAGSLQHHGAQMLGLTETLGSQPLPRPVTGDAAFFDLPIVGLIVYPVSLAVPLAILALLLVVGVIVRDRAGAIVGTLAALIALTFSGVLGHIVGHFIQGPAVWSGLYAAVIVLLAMAVTLACFTLARRWSSLRGLQIGALVLWTVLALGTAIRAPGASYLFVWPLLFAAAGLLARRSGGIEEWLTAAVVLLMLAGFAYGVSVVMLGVAGPGAIALAVLTSLITLLLLSPIDRIVAGATWGAAPWLVAAALIVLAVAAGTVHTGAAHPVRTALVYAENAGDSSDAWLSSVGGGTTNAWTRSAIGATVLAPAWTSRLLERGGRLTGRAVPRVPLDAPNAAFIRDTLINGLRRVVLRVSAPAGTTGLMMHASGAKVFTSSIDGRIVDTTRYRYNAPEWQMQYWAVPDSGAIVALSIPAGAHIDFELTARRPGIPSVPGVAIPPRPTDVVTSQSGDVSVVYKRWRF